MSFDDICKLDTKETVHCGAEERALAQTGKGSAVDQQTDLPPRAIMKLNEIILIHEPESELYLHIVNIP